MKKKLSVEKVGYNKEWIEHALEILNIACLSSEKFEMSFAGNGGLSFVDKGVKGAVKFEKKDIRGFFEGVDEVLQKEEWNEISDCMKPHISRILDIVLGEK